MTTKATKGKIAHKQTVSNEAKSFKNGEGL